MTRLDLNHVRITTNLVEVIQDLDGYRIDVDGEYDTPGNEDALQLELAKFDKALQDLRNSLSTLNTVDLDQFKTKTRTK